MWGEIRKGGRGKEGCFAPVEGTAEEEGGGGFMA